MAGARAEGVVERKRDSACPSSVCCLAEDNQPAGEARTGAALASQRTQRRGIGADEERHQPGSCVLYVRRVGRRRRLRLTGSRELLCVLCVCLSAARSSTPGNEHALVRSVERNAELHAPGGAGLLRSLACFVRSRSIPGVGAGRLEGNTELDQASYPDARRAALGSSGCDESLLGLDSVELSAGDWIAFVPRDDVEWRIDDDGLVSSPDEDSVRAFGRPAQPGGQTGKAVAYESTIVKMTQTGLYRVHVKPQDLASALGSVQLRVQVVSAYPSARNSKACYFAPPTSNDTEVDFSAALPCEIFGPSSEVAFEITEGPSEFLSSKLLGGPDQNSTNVSLSDLLKDRELPLCLTRKCLTLQVRRYDSWSNKVESSEYDTEISVEIQGVDTSMYEVVFRGQSEIRSDGVLKKWETYKWIGLGGESVLGNNSCTQFACNATKLVGPETNVVANVVVRMDGIPLGHGSPFRVVVTGGGFHGFMVDPAYMIGAIAEIGGAAIRLIPIDKAGNPVKGALSHNGKCDPRSSCGRNVQKIMTEPIQASSKCYRNGALTPTSFELDASSMGPFRPDTSCSKRGCGSLVEFFYCNNRFDIACGLDGTKPFATGAAGETSSLANEPPDCFDCPFANGEALIANVDTDIAISCLFNMTWNGTKIQNALQAQNTIATEFFGTTLQEGQFAFTVLAGEPNATMATIRYPWANTTAREFKGAIDPNGAFELIVTLQDSFGNPSGGLVGIVGELRHPQMILNVPYPEFNETTGGFHVVGVVTVSGEYRLQLAMEPFGTPLGGSPFLIDISAGVPVIKNTLLARRPETVTIDSFGQFFFQARDKWNNFASSFHDFFHYKNYRGVSPGNKAPGFWIWLVPRDITDAETGLLLEPVLDRTGFNILRCGDDPDPCRGQDPGLEAFVAAFRPQQIGDYYIELQYCEPGGTGCDEDPFAYNHSSMKPPQAPNPCHTLPAGKGGARLGLACTIDGMGFEVLTCLLWFFLDA